MRKIERKRGGIGGERGENRERERNTNKTEKESD